MKEQEQPQSHDDEIQKKIKNWDEVLREISDGDQQQEAIKNLAFMIASLWKELVALDMDEEIATAMTQSYIEAVVATMFG